MEKNLLQNYVSLAIHASMTNIVDIEILSRLVKTVKQNYYTKKFELASGNLKQT